MRRAAILVLAVAACSQDPRAANPAAYDGILAELEAPAATYFGGPVKVTPVGRTVTGDPCGLADFEDRTYLVHRSREEVVAVATDTPNFALWSGLCEKLSRKTPASAGHHLADAAAPLNGISAAQRGAQASDRRVNVERMEARAARRREQDSGKNVDIDVTIIESRQ